ncbi:tyrosine-type recombinase/integrase [Catenulispora subtropica]|uniref:Core-binding (CB) domain-containing protein n=1 Tax=Catenulispora subtropica TaxID=450798 RepID=A0ABP5E888_9ACTN
MFVEKWPVLTRHEKAAEWLQVWCDPGRAARTIDAYGRGLSEFLLVCEWEGCDPLMAGRADVALFVRELTERPHRRGANVVSIDSGAGLSNATVQQRLVPVRLFFDFLVEAGLRDSNPVGRGRLVPGRHHGGSKRGLVPRFTKLPWIPDEQQWSALLAVAADEPIRNRLMLALAYDAALRREELCSLRTDDVDPGVKVRQTRLYAYPAVQALAACGCGPGEFRELCQQVCDLLRIDGPPLGLVLDPSSCGVGQRVIGRVLQRFTGPVTDPDDQAFAAVALRDQVIVSVEVMTGEQGREGPEIRHGIEAFRGHDVEPAIRQEDLGFQELPCAIHAVLRDEVLERHRELTPGPRASRLVDGRGGGLVGQRGEVVVNNAHDEPQSSADSWSSPASRGRRRAVSAGSW